RRRGSARARPRSVPGPWRSRPRRRPRPPECAWNQPLGCGIAADVSASAAMGAVTAYSGSGRSFRAELENQRARLAAIADEQEDAGTSRALDLLNGGGQVVRAADRPEARPGDHDAGAQAGLARGRALFGAGDDN